MAADSLTITGNLAAVIAELKKAAANIERDMLASQTQIADQARELAVRGTNLGVYNTAPGRQYVRTGDLLRGISAMALSTAPGSFGVRVQNTSKHASNVEYGSYRDEIGPLQASELARQGGSARQPLYLGRSGRNYTKPNPAITRATIYASYALADAYQKILAKHLR